MWSLSQLQLIDIAVLCIFFNGLSREFAIEICTAIDKEKAGACVCVTMLKKSGMCDIINYSYKRG